MDTSDVHFDVKAMEKLVPDFVRERAIKAGSSLIYMEGTRLIREDPRTGEKIILEDHLPNIH